MQFSPETQNGMEKIEALGRRYPRVARRYIFSKRSAASQSAITPTTADLAWLQF